MNSSSLLNQAKSKGITFWFENGSLKYRAPQGTMSPEFIDLLKRHKASLINELREEGGGLEVTSPLSFNQQSLWFLHQLDTNSAAYNVAAACTVNGGINDRALQQTIDTLIDRHQVLRTTYYIENDSILPVQRIHQNIPTTINCIDGSHWSETDISEKVNELYRIPIDLENGPVFRFYSIRLSKDTFILLFVIHHIACDAWSINIFFHEFFKIYSSRLNGLKTDLNKIPMQYTDFVTEQQRLLNTPNGEKLFSFWKKRINGFPQRLTLPLDFERPSIQKFTGDSIFINIEGGHYDRLTEFAKDNKISLYSVLLSTFQILLMAKSGQTEILLGTIAAGRYQKSFHNTMGYFVNPILIPGSYSNKKGYRQYLQETSSSVFSALDHQAYPFSVLVEKIATDRASDCSPIFQVMFNLLSKKGLGTAAHLLCPAEKNDSFRCGDLSIEPFLLAQQEGQFDMTLEVTDTGAFLYTVLKYNTSLFKKETAESYVNDYLSLLEAILENPDLSMAGLCDHVEGNRLIHEKKPHLKLAIASTFTIELVEPAIRFWMGKIETPFNIVFAPYNQIFQQLLDPASCFNENSSGINAIFIRFDDWVQKDSLSPISDIEGNVLEFTNALRMAVKMASSTYVVIFCPPSPNLLNDPELKTQLSRIENAFLSTLNQINGVYPVTSNEQKTLYPVENYYEPMGEDIGHIPYTQDFFDAVSTLLARKIYAIINKPYKVIALDCDNTLWDGVVGEDGVLGVKISQQKKRFQEFIVTQHQAGMVICLCSKNNDADVADVLEQHPDMVLKETQIAARKVNWSPKSQNIRELSLELNLGLDSFIFIDDNPIECAEVQAACPEVLVIQLPEEEKGFEDLLSHMWAFDHLKVTGEDAKRSEFYRTDHQRKTYLQQATSFADFISGLNLEISISDIKPSTIPRVSQLTQRTNQFNMTTVRRSESEILRLSQTGDYHIKTVNASDKFGDYGLVGVIITKSDAGTLTVDSFILSCRALGKGVEHEMAAHCGHLAESLNLDHIEFSYLPTKRNTPAKAFLDATIGDYAEVADGGWTYRVPTAVVSAIRFQPADVSVSSEGVNKQKKDRATSDAAAIQAEGKGEILLEIVKNFNNIPALSNIIHPIKEAPLQTEVSLAMPSLRFKSPAFVSQTELHVTEVWQNVLRMNRIGPDDKFFEIGGKSVLIPQIVIQLKRNHNLDIRIVDVLQYPTIRSLSAFIDRHGDSPSEETGRELPEYNSLQKQKLRALKVGDMLQCERAMGSTSTMEGIAIVGMAGRFPGARNIDEFWDNLINGKESVSTFSDEECRASGVPDDLLSNPGFVKRGGALNDIDLFDASFFGYSHREATLIDPQQRIFLECAYEALENAGYCPDTYEGSIGVYAGCGINYYLLKNLIPSHPLMESVITPMAFFGNDKDFLSTRVSYKLNLTGPSITVQTACSTSLTAINLACQALLTYQCDMALGGGVSLQAPRMKGYLYQEGQILSSDGYCRAFDKDASGTVFGEGAGIVVLKRLEDAIADRDTVYAVIRGIAANNDGAGKAGFTAPGIDGQAAAIVQAQGIAGIEADDITYIETHGTGTPLGDPIEISALTQAFSLSTSKKGFCAIGSVKPNIGHLDVAAGVASIIKTALAIKHKKMPASINFSTENPELQLESTPFFVNDRLREWETNGTPRIAGVSSFGIGGTNIHAVLSEAPPVDQSMSQQMSPAPCHLLLLSAKTETALKRAATGLGDYVARNPDINLADAAYTLMAGRNHYSYRSFVVCDGSEDAVLKLGDPNLRATFKNHIKNRNHPLVFMFSGQGTQYPQMTRDLYDHLPVFREELDRCADALRNPLGLDIRDIIYPDKLDSESASLQLNETWITQPALFSIEYAFAKFLMGLGIIPDIMIGHSIGEYVAACLSGVFSLQDALELIATRGRLVQEQDRGSMLAIQLPEGEVIRLLNGNLTLATVNSPTQCVVSGPTEDIDNLQKGLISDSETGKKILSTKLKTSHAFHSTMMEPAAKKLIEAVMRCQLDQPKIPFVSNVTGDYITEDQATDPGYWGRHLTHTVRFSDGLKAIINGSNPMMVEIGPGMVLSSLAKNHLEKPDDAVILSTIRHRNHKTSDFSFMLKCLGTMWAEGAVIDWSALFKDESRIRIPLPTYPFERKSFWLSQNGFMPSGVQLAAAEENPKTEVTLQEDSVHDTITEVCQAFFGAVDYNLSFIELGFDSLALSELSAKINQEFSIKLPVRRLFDDINSPHRLAEHVIANSKDRFESQKVLSKEGIHQTAGLPADSHKSIETRLETIEQQLKSLSNRLALDAGKGATPQTQLTGPQKDLWTAVLAGGEEASLGYNECRSFSFRGVLNKDALIDSINQLYERHEGLRLLFSEDGMRCEIQDVTAVKLLEHDLISLTDEQKLRRISDLKSEAVSTPFDLARGPLFYGSLVYISDNETLLILVAHHIAVDGPSWEILIREMASLYNARCGQNSVKLPETISFSDYRKLRKDYAASADAREDIRFWQKHLDGQTEDLSLPSDAARPAQRTFSATRSDHLISADKSAKIRKAATEAGCTVYSFLLAAFQTLIHSLTRQTDFILGIPTSGQAAEGLDAFVGHCVDVLPLRTPYNPNTGIREHIKSLHLNLMSALEHQRAEFSEIIRTMKRQRDMSRPTLVQVAFGMGRALRRPEFFGLETEVEVPPRVSEAYELYVYVANIGGETLEIGWSYNTDLFSEETISAWQRCYEKAIMSLVYSSPNQVLKDIAVVSDQDHRKLVELAQGPHVDHSNHIPVHQRIAKTADSFPNKTAIYDHSGRYSYREIEASANQFARYLLSQGFNSSKLVAVCLDRSFDLVTTLIGIWRAGLGYIPLDPTYPDKRIEMIIEDSSAPPVITSKKYRERFPSNCSVICIEEIKSTIAKFETSAPSVTYSPLDTAYVIFTSGSTGRPKGVQIPQGAVENFICAMARSPGYSENDLLLAITTISFDISVLELFLPLSVGGAVIVASAEQAREPKMLEQFVAEFDVTVMQATPATWQMLFDGGWKGHKNLKVLCGGEAFPKHLADLLLANCGEVWNVYGPTETTVWSSTQRIEDSSCLTIGRPIDNTTMYVLDEGLRLVPPGAHGELWIGGYGVADGYIGRDELTAERFCKNPFDDTDRIYRTGDLARIRPDGDFECLGRIDFQTKIRGFRIELGEIETALMSHNQVAVGAVVARENDQGRKYLAAYIVTQKGQDIEIESLRRYLSEKLPDYMVPNRFMVLPSLPMTPNNKVDRKALPQVEPSRKSPESEHVHDDTVDEIEAKVLDKFRQQLDLPELTRGENFFSAGGDSLLAIQTVQKLNDYFNRSLSVDSFFRNPTARDFAALFRPDVSDANDIASASTNARLKIGRQHNGLFLIKKGNDSGPVLFLIHGDLADNMLPPLLPASLEIWGYSHQGSDGGRICYETVESIAKNCYEEWIEKHGDRDCIVAGHSFGSLVAFHVGVLRQNMQLKTPALVLLDSRNPHSYYCRVFPTNFFKLRGLLIEQNWIRRSKHKIKAARAYLDRGEYVPANMRTDYILGTYMLASYRYNPPIYSGKLHHLRSTELIKRAPNDGWHTAVAGEIQTEIFQGSHLDMVRSNTCVVKIAEYLKNHVLVD